MDNLFGDSARRLFAQAYPSDVLRAVEQGQAPSSAWQAIEASGFLDALLPEEAGGAGLRLADVVPLAREAGAHAVGAPVIQTMLARAWLHAAGHTPPAGPIALAPFPASANGPDTYAPAVPAARAAQWVLLAVPGGARLLATADAESEPAGGHGCLDADLRWTQASVEQAALLQGDHAPLADLAAAACAGLIAGALEHILHLTVEYANQRSQFGKPIGRFQAVQQQISVLAEHVWSVRTAAQLAFQSPDWKPRPLLAALGKARASAAVPVAADIAHAVHGAIGVTAEYDLQCYTRRLREWRRAGGSETCWQARIGADALSAPDVTALDYVRENLFGMVD